MKGKCATTEVQSAADELQAIRDMFAAAAMAAYCSDADWRADMSNDMTAKAAYSMADEMLKARSNGLPDRNRTCDNRLRRPVLYPTELRAEQAIMGQPPGKKTRKRSSTQTVDSLRIPEALLKIQTVTAVTGLSEATIRRKVADGKFPAPIKDGLRCTRWLAGAVSNWLRAKGEGA